MNRVFDEQRELQLQEYEFAELDQLLPGTPVLRQAAQQEDAEAMLPEAEAWH